MIMTRTGKVKAIALPETPAAEETAACSTVENENDDLP